MESVFDLLRSNGVLTRRGVDRLQIASLSANAIVDIATAAVDQTETVPEPRLTTFTHAASISLSGARAECEALPHRLDKAEELGRFAVMYSDKIYIPSFFSDYEHQSEGWGEKGTQEAFYNDVKVLSKLRPLIEKGFVEIYTPFFHHCLDCVEEILGKSFQAKLKRGGQALARQYYSQTSVNLSYLDDLICEFELNAPEPYLDHEMVIYDSADEPIHEKLRQMPRLRKKLAMGEPVPLASHITRQLGLHKYLAGGLVRSVSSGMLTSKLSNSTYLTGSPLEVDLLQSLSDQVELNERNNIAQKYLTSIVPFVADVPLNKLIKLRNREEESFIQYRAALNDAIDEFKLAGARFSEKDARALYSDVIEPRLAALEQGVKTAKRDLTRNLSQTIIAVTAAISFGLYTGFIPSELLEMAKVIGFTKVASDVVKKLLQTSDAERSIKNESLYFLWKVKKLG